MFFHRVHNHFFQRFSRHAGHHLSAGGVRRAAPDTGIVITDGRKSHHGVRLRVFLVLPEKDSVIADSIKIHGQVIIPPAGIGFLPASADAAGNAAVLVQRNKLRLQHIPAALCSMVDEFISSKDFLCLIMLRLFSPVLIYSGHGPVFLVQELLVNSDLVRLQLRLDIEALVVDQVAAAVRSVQLRIMSCRSFSDLVKEAVVADQLDPVLIPV